MDVHAERRVEQRHACEGTMNWVYFNKECYGTARVLNYSQNGSYFETNQALVLGSTVLIHVFKCMDCLDVSKAAETCDGTWLKSSGARSYPTVTIHLIPSV
jgi:hypothetical protein